MTAYVPSRFVNTYEGENGPAIWKHLNQHDNIIRMETATYLSRPAVEPLSPFLLQEFGERVRDDRIKQMIGHMVRQIMERNGYRIDRSNVRINRDQNIFVSGTRYTANLAAPKVAE